MPAWVCHPEAGRPVFPKPPRLCCMSKRRSRRATLRALVSRRGRDRSQLSRPGYHSAGRVRLAGQRCGQTLGCSAGAVVASRGRPCGAAACADRVAAGVRTPTAGATNSPASGAASTMAAATSMAVPAAMATAPSGTTSRPSSTTSASSTASAAPTVGEGRTHCQCRQRDDSHQLSIPPHVKFLHSPAPDSVNPYTCPEGDDDTCPSAARSALPLSTVPPPWRVA